MARPLPITPSSLDCFVTCGKQFYHKYVAKDLPRSPQTAEQLEGDRVHAAFEARLGSNVPLPKDLMVHEPHMARLEAIPGVLWVEEKVALGRDLQPTTYDDPDRFWRGKIDFRMVARDAPTAVLEDYKTGKPFDKWTQLAQYAIHTFALFPTVDICDCRFYWTQTRTITRKVWGRAEIPDLWALITPDLKQMKLAFASDTWQERPSGLCRGWCEVTSCQHWEPKRPKR